MAFTVDQLLLSADKAAQLTAALATATVADPLLLLCTEAAADVDRMTTGYVLDPLSVENFVRSLALYRAYSKAGLVPKDVQTDYDAATKELEAIAEGKRPNLPRATTGTNPPSGKWGGATKVTGRMGS